MTRAWWDCRFVPSAQKRLFSLFGVSSNIEPDVILVSTPSAVPSDASPKALIASATTTPIPKRHCICLQGEPKLMNVTATVEFTWALVHKLTLGLVRQDRELIDQASNAAFTVEHGAWNRWNHGRERMLSRMTLGVIGDGRIGQQVARVGKAFGMIVFTTNYHSDVLLRESDIITLHTPVGPPILQRPDFKLMKQGVILINTAQGNAIDKWELLEGLKTGHVKAAALDCLEGEFGPDFDPTQDELVNYARNHSNLLITPHIAGSSRDAWEMTQHLLIDKVVRHFEIGKT